MTHYRMREVMPVGIILAKNSRTGSLDELKTYKENVIYLNDGNEFQIRLFNPLQERIGALIGINGQFSSSYFVLNPGQDIIIDRFIDTQKKMLFETYQYDSSNQDAQNAVSKNGIIEIKFFKEYVPVTYSNIIYTTNAPLYNDTSGGNIYLNNLDSNIINSCNYNQVTTDKIDINLTNLEFKSDESLKSYTKRTNNTLKETGRINTGSKSSQVFEKTEIQFDHYSFHQINYKLKPISEKEEVIEIREYCKNCSYRIRNKNWVYCPKCGNKI